MRALLSLLPTALLGVSLLSSDVEAQTITTTSGLNLFSPSYEEEADKLRVGEPQQYDFSNAMLGDVLRFLATDAGMDFISLPVDSPDAGRMITFSIRKSPFSVLETLCKAHGLAIIPDNGIWYIRPADDKELVGKSYAVRYNSLERVEHSGASSNSSGGVSPTGGGISSGSGGGSTGGGGGVSLQGGQESFIVRRSEFINDIRTILGLPPEETEMGNQAASGAVGAVANQGEDMAKAMNSNELSSFRKPKVIWKSDSNTLYVVATRLQHMWVEGYLAASDKPQTLLAIEVKFIESSRDPTRDFGIDWGGTFDTGNMRQVSDVTQSLDPDTGVETTKIGINNVPTTGGYRVDLSNLISTTNLNAAKGALGWPALGVLSGQDLNVKLRALLRDQETKTTSYPRMVTLNNREVSFRAVQNLPVLDATASASLGGGATQTQSVTYLPIGTVLNILPKHMEGDKILLNMAITVSSVIGTSVIGGNAYPVASTRQYNSPVEVPSGFTVAVGGLDEAREQEGKTGIPWLSGIPGLGKLFKYDSKSKNHKTLMLFITPNIIDAREGGLPNEPQSVVPQRPGKYLPKIPQIDPRTGALIGGPRSLPNAVTYLERETDILHHTITESRITEDESRKAKELKVAIEQLRAQCDIMKVQYPGDLALIEAHQQQLSGLLVRNQEIGRLLWSKKYR
jgi:hypothetical protein